MYETLLGAELDGDWSTLIDVGCGTTFAQAKLIAERIPYTVGVDGHAPTVELCKAEGPYTTYHCADALAIVDLFGESSFDVAVALDVVEHFPKRDGERLLDCLETVARHKVVVFTPNGFLHQGEKDENPLQVHRSGWTVAEFRARGYRVAGVNGLKPLRGELWEPRIRPPALGHRISAATQPLVTRRAKLAFQLLAVLDIA